MKNYPFNYKHFNKYYQLLVSRNIFQNQKEFKMIRHCKKKQKDGAKKYFFIIGKKDEFKINLKD
jgi:hypothetical protein